MPYPAPFHRLVLIGNAYTDRWNTTLSIVPQHLGAGTALGPVTPTLLENVATAVSTWYAQSAGLGGLGFTGGITLTGIKLNRIGPDGHYMDPETMEHTFPAPVVGGGPNTFQAAQLSLVATIETNTPRGRASRGRQYWPPCLYSTLIQNDGRISAVAAAEAAVNAGNFLETVGVVYVESAAEVTTPAFPGVASNQGVGQFRLATAVNVGRVIDTQRSRRSSLEEDRQSAPI